MKAIRSAVSMILVAMGAVIFLTGCGETTGVQQGTGAAPPAAKEPAQAVSVLELPKPDTSPLLSEKCFVTKWLVLGPFKFGPDDFGGGHQQPANDKEFMPNEGALDGTQKPPEGLKWQEVQFKGDKLAGQVSLDKLYDKIDNAAAYAVAWLNCPQEVKDARLLIGSDDYVKVWVNGKLVHTYSTARRASEWDQDTVPGIALQKGYNRVVVKCVDVVFDWDFYFRLADKDGKPITVTSK